MKRLKGRQAYNENKQEKRLLLIKQEEGEEFVARLEQSCRFQTIYPLIQAENQNGVHQIIFPARVVSDRN